MKLIQLRYFASIVENGGFIAAAREVNVAQPALSRQVAELEAELGVELLNRGPGGTTVTQAGQRFYRHARTILTQIQIAGTEARQSSGDLTGEIRIAVPVGYAGFLAPKIVAQVEQSYPDLIITIVDGLGYQTGELIETGKVDFGIISDVASMANVLVEPILQENLFVFSKRRQQKPEMLDMPLVELESEKLIMPGRKVHVRRIVEEALMQIGRKLNVSYEQQSLLTIRSMVCAGVGSTVMNWPSMADIWESGSLDARNIISPSLSRTVSLGIPTLRPLTSASRTVYDIIRQILMSEVSEGRWRGQLVNQK